MALNGLYCADVSLSNYSLTYWYSFDECHGILCTQWTILFVNAHIVLLQYVISFV